MRSSRVEAGPDDDVHLRGTADPGQGGRMAPHLSASEIDDGTSPGLCKKPNFMGRIRFIHCPKAVTVMSGVVTDPAQIG
jgi:hypothetical protein